MDVVPSVRDTKGIQVHRETIVFESDRIYPEYIVYYRLDSAEFEAEKRAEYKGAIREKFDAQQAELLQQLQPLFLTL